MNGVTCGGTTADTATRTQAPTTTAPADEEPPQPPDEDSNGADQTATAGPTASPARDEDGDRTGRLKNCTDYAALVRGKYWVNNNVWGKAAAPAPSASGRTAAAATP